jgi:hypothetical protein
MTHQPRYQGSDEDTSADDARKPLTAGLGVFCGYAAAALLTGFIMISRRDA